MKKILFLLNNSFSIGGIQRTVSVLTKNLSSKKKYNIEILSLFKTSDRTNFDYGKNIKHYNLFKNPIDIKKNYFKIKNKLTRKLYQLNPDILVVENIGLTLLLHSFFKKSYIKDNNVIVCEHGSFSNGKIFGLRWFGRRIAAKYSNAIIVLTKADKLEYQDNIKHINYIDYIYNPIPMKFNKNKYNLDSKKIIACGRLSYEKGFDLLIKALKDVFKVYSSWSLDIYGEGPEKDKLTNIIKKNNLENNINLCGWVKDIHERYKEYSFLVVPSRREGFGMVIIEALKSGLPVVSFDVPSGPKEIIYDNKNGLLAKANSTKQLCSKVKELINSKSKRKKLADNTDYNLDRFSIDSVIKKWEYLFDNINNL